jgi:clan AA aspartic protease (TIGR02281 family)
MDKYKIGFLMVLAAIFIAAPSSADRINLKNGGSIEGIIEKESEKSVDVNIGFGRIILGKSQVKDIERSSAQDSHNIAANWEIKRKELASKEKEFEEAREIRFREAHKHWLEEEKEKKLKEDSAVKNIQIMRDQMTKGIVVEALLNDNVKANLILDTGASIIVLSRNIGEALGIDLSGTNINMMELRLADGRSAPAKAFVLDSVKIQDVEVRKVMAAIMLDQEPGRGAGDGLLGMSFLNKFNLKMDLKNMKMALERIPE